MFFGVCVDWFVIVLSVVSFYIYENIKDVIGKNVFLFVYGLLVILDFMGNGMMFGEVLDENGLF